MEKTYKFKEYKSAEDFTTHEVKEADLSTAQKNLLLGEVIKQFNDLPEELKLRFMNEAIRHVGK